MHRRRVFIFCMTLGILLVGTAVVQSALSRAASPGDVPVPVPAPAASPRFAFVDVYVDAADVPLAAYQVELTAAGSRMLVVGVEGGAVAPFDELPYFDRHAVDAGRADRLIVGAFSTKPAAELPVGRVRVARIHVMLEGTGPARFRTTVQAAADAEGRTIRATASFVEGTAP